MLGGMIALAKLGEIAYQEWLEKFEQMTLEEKLAELQKPEDILFDVGGISAVMFFVNAIFAVNIFWNIFSTKLSAIVFMALLLIVVGAGPIMGLHFDYKARLRKRYGVHQRTAEDTWLDSSYASMVVLAAMIVWPLDNLAINLLVLTISLANQVVLIRWSFLGKSPIKAA